MKEIMLLEIDLSTLIIETHKYSCEEITNNVLSNFEEETETLSDTEIEALLAENFISDTDKNIIKDYLKEQLDLAPDALLNDIPTELLVDLLDIDKDAYL